MTDPAAEAAFEKWLRDHPPGTANVHRAFVAGWEARGPTFVHVCSECLAELDPERIHVCTGGRR